MTDRPRVLVIAEAANPEWMSVPLVGWSLAHALREVAKVTLVTQIRNRDAILRAGYRENADFVAIDSEAFARPMHRLGALLRGGKGKGWTTSTAIGALAYPYFERLVWDRFGADIAAGAYDLVHRVTPVSPTVNGGLARRCKRAGVPFVLGPLNGGVPWPAAFDRERRQEREWLSYVRGVYKVLPGRKSTIDASAAILAGSRHTLGELPRGAQPRAIWLPENAIDPARFDLDRPRPPFEPPLRSAFVGRLVPYKGPDMALTAALPLLKDGRMRFDVLGDGPMMPALRALVSEAGVEDAVTFHGMVPHVEVERVLGRADVLAFPSIREFGGGVVLEAMALGTVPVVVNYAGPGELVTPDTAIPLPLGDRESIVAAMREALEALAADASRLGPLSEAGRSMVRDHFTWAAKARQVRDVYDWVLGRRADKPSFRARAGTGHAA